MILALLACTGPDDGDTAAPADLPSVLVELAQLFSTDLIGGLHAALATTIDGLADGASDSGSLFLRDGANELIVDWSLAYREDTGTEGLRYWDWALNVDYEVALPSAYAAGGATWTVEWEQYDYTILRHAWTGTSAVDGAEPVDAAWTGVGTPTTLNTLEGTIDGEPVTWENPDPDVP